MALPPSSSLDKTDARPDAAQEMLMREVDEAVRQDEALSFARKYGWKVGGGLALALAAFGGFLFWQNREQTAREREAEQLIAAMDELQAGNTDVADGELGALAQTAEGGAGALARILRGGIALESGDSEAAVQQFAAVSANDDLPQALRDLATVREVAAAFDTMEPQAVIDRLGPLAVEGNAFYGSAGELVAFAYLEQGKTAEAGALLVAIAKDDDVPPSLRARTRQLAGLLGFDAIEDVDATMAELRGDGAPAGATQ